jgi:hypothetical protein
MRIKASLLIVCVLIGCSNNPPTLSTIHLSDQGNYGAFLTMGARVTGPMTYRVKDTTWSGLDTSKTERLLGDLGGQATISKRWRYFALGGGISNLNLLFHGSFIYPDRLSVSPYFSLSRFPAVNVYPGLLIGYTPSKYFGVSFAGYRDYNYKVWANPSGLAPAMPSARPLGPFWMYDGSLFLNISSRINNAVAYPFFIGVKHQVGTNYYTGYLSIALSGIAW